MSQRRREDGPAVEDRWWVDTGKTTERSRAAATGERPPIGTRFFDIGYEFDQERARTRLTDVNLKFLEEAAPEIGEWKMIRMVPDESVPPAELERLKARLPLPPRARGVIVDSGRSVRFIITGDPVGERSARNLRSIAGCVAIGCVRSSSTASTTPCGKQSRICASIWSRSPIGGDAGTVVLDVTSGR
jgi:hypothetical protein